MDHIDQNYHIVDHIDQHGELKPKLLAIVPPISMNGHDIFVPKIEQDAVRSHSANRIKHGFKKVLEKGKTDTNGVITWGGFNSQRM